ncbi:hypothetical protein KY285_013285 [Solanum tuberosum]|nr:hypothetical protein KY284_013277 [Solanum tuberosum]KAH0717254.1 hypothetical protein KY285_013285 [Solanum tuberosum]
MFEQVVGSKCSVRIALTLQSSHPFWSCRLEEELSFSQSKEAPEYNEQEIIQSVSSPTDTGRRRSRKGVDGAIARAISEMAVTSTLSSPEAG